MSVNSSACSNGSTSFPSLPHGLYCLICEPRSLVFSTFTMIAILLFSLSIIILYYGLQRWRQGFFSTAATTTHSDSFTYNIAILEIFSAFGSIICCYGIYKHYLQMLVVWYYLYCFAWYGETFFQVLTCVEHYLAVVHPVTYVNLRKQRWIRNRNVLIGCIWPLCFAFTFLLKIGIGAELGLVSCSFIIILFCSLSVLRVLIHPSPGDHSGERERVDPAKLRAFYTIMAILGVLLLRCVWNMTWDVLYLFNGKINKCIWIICGIWINFPGSLVLPLLFIHRVGPLACCKKMT